MASAQIDSQIETEEELEQRFLIISRVELGMAALATLLLVILHIVCLMDNPALWRDEIAALNLSQVNSFKKFWELCEFDSSFAFWFVVLRSWTTVFGSSDLSMRILGTGIGLALLGTCWWAARKFHCKYPLVTLSLFSLNSAVIYWGDTIRGYGLGTLLLLVMLCQIWSYTENPSWKRLLLAFLPALMAVHTLYYNCIFLFAICLGSAAVSWRTRNWRAILQILGMGFVCALTMLVYVDVIRRVGAWRSVVVSPLSMKFVIDLFNGAAGYAAYVLDFVWATLVPLTVIIFAVFAVVKWKSGDRPLSQRSLYLLVTYVVGLAGYFGLLFWHGYQPQPWHFVPILGFVIIPIETAMMDAVRRSEAGRKLRLYFVFAFWLLVFYSTFTLVESRRTSVDIATRQINEKAQPGDLVVVQPMYYGITFRHYHNSKAGDNWVAVPGMTGDELLVHRYDILRDLLYQKSPANKVLQQIDDTLKAGHTVWYVGTTLKLHKEMSIGPAPPPLTPTSKFGSGHHMQYWDKLFYRHFEDHAEKVTDLHVGSFNLYGFENAFLVSASGWQEKTAE